MSIIQGSAMQGASRGFYPKEIEGSLRFNSADTAHLKWKPESNGNRKTWTFSCWMKLADFTPNEYILGAGSDSSNQFFLTITTNAELAMRQELSNTTYTIFSNEQLRDVSAWYHIVAVFDSTQATAADRMVLYINGNKYNHRTGNYVPQNYEGVINSSTYNHYLGALRDDALGGFDGYLAEVFFIDGTAHDADDFGETKNGVWVPKDITASDFTMGTNGFHLTFEDDTEVEAFNTVLYRGNGGTQTITGTGFKPDFVWIKERNNATSHVLHDSVRGANAYLISNLTNAEASASTTVQSFDSDGFTVGSAGSWNGSGDTYVAWCWDAGANNAVTGHSSVTFEGTGSRQVVSGLPFKPDLLWFKDRDATRSHALVDSVRGRSKALFPDLTNAEGTSSGSEDLVSFEDGGFIVGTPARSGSFNASGQSIVAWAWDAGDGDPVSNTDGSITSTVKTNGDFSIISFTGTGANATVGHGLSAAPDWVIFRDRDTSNNWGIYHSSLGETHSIKLNVTDAAFDEAAIFNDTAPTSSVISLGNSGLCNSSGNKMIAYAWRDVTGKQKFGKYTGNASSTGPTVNLGFRPGFVMIKGLDRSSVWYMFDTSRMPFDDSTNYNHKYLRADSSNAEYTVGDDGKIEVTSTGFQVRAGVSGMNASGEEYIYAAFAGSYSDYITDYNTDGSIDSRVKASDTTGFSIVSYEGTGSDGTVGHGLSSAPDWIVIKSRDAARAWCIWHTSLTDDYKLNFNTNAASLPSPLQFDTSENSSSVFGIGTNTATNNSGENYIAYCWTETAGVSKFGGYSGSSSEVTINVGFNPAWVLIKNTSSAGFNWGIFDNTRNTDGTLENPIYPNTSGVEETGYSNPPVTFDGNNIKVRGGDNGFNNTGQTYIYAAFADTREAAFWLDQSGNDNDWQPVNLDHNDTLLDSPTNNFATLNPFNGGYNPTGTLSDGNLRVTTNNAGTETYGTMAIPSSGQYYWEATVEVSNNAYLGIGLLRYDSSFTRYRYLNNGQKDVNGTTSSYGDSFAAGDVIGVAVDADAETIEFYKNGTGQGSFSIDLSLGDFFPLFMDGNSSASSTFVVNFGQQPFKYGPPE